MTEGRERMAQGMLASWESKKLEIETGEPPIDRVVHALCYNEVVKSLTTLEETEKKL